MAHDSDRGVQHKHSDWAPTRDGKCPCGKEEWPSDPVDIVSESVREYVGDGEGADEEVLYKYNLSIAEKIIEGVIRENCSFRQLPDRIRYHAVEGMTSYE